MTIRKLKNWNFGPFPIFVFFVVLLAGSGNLAWQGYDKDIRGESIDVLQYTLNINILDIDSHQISGIADLQIRSLKDGVSKIHLDLLSLKVDSVWVDEDGIKDFTHVGEKLIIPLFEPLDKEATVLISVFYHGEPTADPSWGGFYFKDNYAFNMGVGMKSIPPAFGRAWYPCVDSFTDRAGYDYFITVSKENTAVCPGLLKEIVENEDGSHTFHWELQSSIPTYLSSVAVSNYVCLCDTFNGMDRDIPVMIFVAPEDSMNAAGSFRDLPKWMRCFEELYGPYKWEKIGFVSTPFSGGAMEHATAISFSRTTLFDTTRFKGILIHELAHNWFGNLVTCETADDMWLNEGWASYSVAHFIEWEKGDKEYMDYVMQNHENVLRFAHIRDKTYRSVYGNAPDFTYGSTVYKKGADVVYNLRNYIGDDYFLPAIKKYFETFSFTDINSNEFKEFFADQTETDLDQFFDFWVYGAGFSHFSIDSVKIDKQAEDYQVKVYSHQKLLGTNKYSNNNHLDILFLGKGWAVKKDFLQMSGELDSTVFILDFIPETVVLNPFNKLLDATTGSAVILKHTGKLEFKNACFSLDVKRLKDSAFFKVTKDWVSPDINGVDFEIDNTSYWTIVGYDLERQSLVGKFNYENMRYSPNDFIQDIKKKGKIKSLELLYRSGAGEKWQVINAKGTHSENGGTFTTSFIKNGEYCIGMEKNGE